MRASRASNTVAHVRHRLDDRGIAELRAETAHGDPDRSREWICVLVPDPLEELAGRDHPTFRSQQQLQHSELLRSELDRTAAPKHPALRQIKLDVAMTQHRWEDWLCAPDQRHGPRAETRTVKGRGEIVVRTQR